MKIECDYRFQFQDFEKNGFKALPKHQKGYITREKHILEMYTQHDNNTKTDEELLSSITNLFIPEKIFDLVEKVTSQIENADEIEEDNIINEAA